MADGLVSNRDIETTSINYSFSTRSNNQITQDKRPGTLMACQFGSLELKSYAIHIQNCAAVPRLIQC